MADALGEGADRNGVFLVRLPRLFLLDLIRGELHLEDVGPELRGDLRAVRDHVDRGLARLADAGPARIRPDDDREACPLRFLRERPDLLVHAARHRGARVDRESDRGAAQPERLADAPRDRRQRVLLVVQHVVVVELQDERDLAGELGSARLQESERGGVRVAARLDRQVEVISGIVGRRVGSERPGRTVLEALVDRKDDHPAGSGEGPVIQHPGQVRLRTRIVRRVPPDDLADARRGAVGERSRRSFAGSRRGCHGPDYREGLEGPQASSVA